MKRALAMMGVLWVLMPGVVRAEVPGEVREQVEARLKEAVPWPGARLRVGAVRVIGPAPEGEWELRLRDRDDFVGRVQAEIVSGGTVDQRTWVQATVVVEVPVWVTSREVAAGERIEGVVQREWRRLDRLPRGFMVDRRGFEGAVARNHLAAGRVVSKSRVELPVVVKRQAPVRLVVKRGDATATDRGVALGDARRGQAVRVRSATTGRILTGLVRGDDVVEVP